MKFARRFGIVAGERVIAATAKQFIITTIPKKFVITRFTIQIICTMQRATSRTQDCRASLLLVAVSVLAKHELTLLLSTQPNRPIPQAHLVDGLVDLPKLGVAQNVLRSR